MYSRTLHCAYLTSSHRPRNHLRYTLSIPLRTFVSLGSGLLTFTLYYLIKHPDAMRKAREEIDAVLGDGEVQLTDLGKLKYIVGE